VDTENLTMSKPKFIDLFSGAGGLGIGLQKAGFEPLVSVDFDKDAIETLKSHSDHEALRCDIGHSIKEIENGSRKFKGIDLLAGGPPCQGFCSINPNRSENDPRNSLVDAFLHVADLVNPKIILIENVTGLLSLAKGFAIKNIQARLEGLGYTVNYKVLQAAHYGVPQSRWRLFVVASKKGNFVFPEPTHRAKITPNFIRGRELTFPSPQENLFSNFPSHTSVWEAISDLPPIENGGSLETYQYASQPSTDYQSLLRHGAASLHNHETKFLQEVNYKRIKFLSAEGMNWTDLPDNLMPKNLKKMREKYKGGVGAKTRFQRLRKDGFFSTIVTSPDPYWGAFIHPLQNRVISVREAARAQSFSDTVVFQGALNSKYRQVGNAVPPLLANAIGEKLYEVL
jgi:DNA (cytosine-5)-methyltransferase 1